MKIKITEKSGSLLKNRKGQVVEYPKVNGVRNKSNPNHWEWHFTWREKVDDRWKSRCVRVKPKHVNKVKALILRNAVLSEILAVLTESAEVPTLSEAGWGWIASDRTIPPQVN